MHREQRFKNFQKIGQGIHGIVLKADDTLRKEVVAIKSIKISPYEQGIPSTVIREISILKELQHHPNIIQYLVYSYPQITIGCVPTTAQNTYDLKRYLKEYKNIMTPRQIQLFMFQLINGVDYCHSRRILHRDLKPQNLLIDHNGNLKIADFGLARPLTFSKKTLTQQIYTLWYRSPELLLGQNNYSLGVDIWAIGCIFAELMEKRPLFKGDSQIDQILKIFQFHGTPTPENWPDIINLPHFKLTFPKFKAVNPKTHLSNFDSVSLDLFLKLTTLDPKKRIGLKLAIKHPYFGNIEDSLRERYTARH